MPVFASLVYSSSEGDWFLALLVRIRAFVIALTPLTWGTLHPLPYLSVVPLGVRCLVLGVQGKPTTAPPTVASIRLQAVVVLTVAVL